MRSGKVYRLYTKGLFDRLAEHELSEVHRQPLSEVVLRMRVMLDDDQKHSPSTDKNNGKDKGKGKNLANISSSEAAAVLGGGDQENGLLEDATDGDYDDTEQETDPNPENAVPSSSLSAMLWKCDGVLAVLMALLEPPEMDQVQGLARQQRHPLTFNHSPSTTA